MEKINEKNIIRASVSDIMSLYEDEIRRLEYNNLNRIGNRSNNNGGLHKCRYAIYLLCSLNPDTVLAVEGCWGDMQIRDFCLTNSGSIVEAIIKAILDHESNEEYVKAWATAEADTINGCMEWEIKASLDSHYKATPATGNRVTVLINRSGVSIIRKKDVAECVDSKGRLPATGLFGNRNNFMIAYLEKALGIEGGYEE